MYNFLNFLLTQVSDSGIIVANTIKDKVIEYPFVSWFIWFPYIMSFLALALYFIFKDMFRDPATKRFGKKEFIAFMTTVSCNVTFIYICVTTKTVPTYIAYCWLGVMLSYFAKDLIPMITTIKGNGNGKSPDTNGNGQ